MGTCIEFDPSLAVNQYNKSLEQELVKDMAFEVGDNQLRYKIVFVFWTQSRTSVMTNK